MCSVPGMPLQCCHFEPGNWILDADAFRDTAYRKHKDHEDSLSNYEATALAQSCASETAYARRSMISHGRM